MDYIFEDLHVFFYSDDPDNDYASNYNSTEVFGDTMESLQREGTTEIGEY